MVQPTAAGDHRRIRYLESLRGVAALQVVLLHIVSALFPGLAVSTPALGTVAGYVRASPLFFLYDGYSAVYIFFILSGYVLTEAYLRRDSMFLPATMARAVRLAVPVFGGCLLAAGFYWVFRDLHDRVGSITHSAWMVSLWHPKLGLVSIVRDSLWSGILVGYQGSSTFQAIIPELLQPATASFDFPLWTLSIEFQGSLLVFFLCDARKGHRAAWLIFLAIAFGMTGFTHFLCFLVGHLAALHRVATRPPWLRPLGALALLFAGVLLCVRAELWQAPLLVDVCRIQSTYALGCTSPYHLQKTLGAILVFFGITQLLTLRRWLSGDRLFALGRISFPLYIVHVPVLFGFASYVFVAVLPVSDAAGITARFAAAAAALAGSLLLAHAFRPVDGLALRLAGQVRAACEGLALRPKVERRSTTPRPARPPGRKETQHP